MTWVVFPVVPDIGRFGGRPEALGLEPSYAGILSVLLLCLPPYGLFAPAEPVYAQVTPKMYKCYVIELKLLIIGFCKTFLLRLYLEPKGFVWNLGSAQEGEKNLGN